MPHLISRRLLAVACGALALLTAVAARAEEDAGPSAPMHEQILSIPGDPARPVLLEATLFEPPGDGPFPLAVMNHGAEGNPRTVGRYHVSLSIDYLLSRGYAVVAPMMRGFSGSGGVAEMDGCDDATIGRANARDILGVVADMKQRPEIDASRVLVMGQSFGGWNALATGALGAPEVRGVVNFVGGLRASRCASQDEAMWSAMADFGASSRLPSIWFYGERDKLFPQSVWRKDYERFTHAGGRAKLVDFGDMEDAHNLLGHVDKIGFWAPKVDAYLAERGLPHEELHPEYLPPPAPARTNYAGIDDVDAVPFIGRANPEFYRKFLSTPARPRVLVVSPKSASMQTGGFDPVARALTECAKQSEICWLYAYNDEVVWSGPAPGQTAKIGGAPVIGKAAPGGTLTEINKFFALSKDCAVQSAPEAKIAAPPAHGEAVLMSGEANPSFPADNPLSACNAVKAPVVRVTYKSRGGFQGVDFFAVSLSEDGKPPRLFKFAVHVE